MIKSLKIAALALAVPAVILGSNPVSAVGSVEGGDIYRVRNVTKNTAFTDPATADKCETVQFKVRIHNPGPDALGTVNVVATLPAEAATSQSSQVTVSSDDANPSSRTDTAGVNLTGSYKLNYVAGSTQLLDPNNTVLQNLDDGIIGSGVTLTDGVGVSLEQIRFVQFSAKVDCPEQPPVCTVNCTPTTPPQTPAPVSKVTPNALPSTGPEALLGGLTGVSALGYGVSRFIQSRREQ